MPMHWLQMDIARWQAEHEIAQQRLSDVEADIDVKGFAYIKGRLRWKSTSGHEYGPFGIRIVYPHDFPMRRQVPRIYLDERPDDWVSDIDGHVLSGWQLCLFVAIECGIDFEQHDSLGNLIDLLPPFLTRQRIFQRDLNVWRLKGGEKPVWPGPQRSHGYAGFVEALEAHGPLGEDEFCLCGSGETYGSCHMMKISEAKYVRRDESEKR
jgi:hypothetical protein